MGISSKCPDGISFSSSEVKVILHTEGIREKRLFKRVMIMSAMRDIHNSINNVAGTDIEIKYFKKSCQILYKRNEE